MSTVAVCSPVLKGNGMARQDNPVEGPVCVRERFRQTNLSRSHRPLPLMARPFDFHSERVQSPRTVMKGFFEIQHLSLSFVAKSRPVD